MICEDMRATGVLGNPGEHFNRWVTNADLDWKAELSALFEKGTGSNGVFSVKIMGNQIKPVNDRLATDLPVTDDLPPLAELFQGALWVWVRRRDTLAQAISRYIAQQSGVYHLSSRHIGGAVRTREDSEARTSKVSFDFKEIMQGWHWLTRYDLLWEVFFEKTRLEPLTIWYEDATIAHVGETIADAIGVPLPERISPRAVQKLAGRRTDEIRQAFLQEFVEKG